MFAIVNVVLSAARQSLNEKASVSSAIWPWATTPTHFLIEHTSIIDDYCCIQIRFIATGIADNCTPYFTAIENKGFLLSKYLIYLKSVNSSMIGSCSLAALGKLSLKACPFCPLSLMQNDSVVGYYSATAILLWISPDQRTNQAAEQASAH